MVPLKLYVFQTPERPLKRFLVRLIKSFLSKEKVCHIALAGGKTPIELYRELSRERLPWDRLRFYLSDERYVDINSDLSNYKALRESLGSRAKLSFFKTEMDIEECAMDYSFQLPERLHIALLGVGEDGHTASLFPNVECREVSQKVCISRSHDGLLRLSLSYSYLSSSCVVIFFLKGEGKKEALESMLTEERLPAGMVRGSLRTYIFTNINPRTI